MIWVDREVKKIKERGFKKEWVDDMKTPSGRVHVGALRGVLIHDLMYKALKQEGLSSVFTYVFDDQDPMDAIPAYLDFKTWEQYSGMQLYQIPSPVPGYPSYAAYYAQEFQDVFEKIGCHPRIIWGSKLYLSGKMNGAIKTVLNSADRIRDIYFRILKSKQNEHWYPFSIMCEKCRKIGTTQVYRWDGRLVHYRCVPQAVAWAQGCGHTGKTSPYSGAGKIPWKIEWAAKWKVIGVTIEGAGKDHMSKGGSHDIASEISKEIFDYPVPHPISYEWFTVGGKKMSSSKGIGASAHEISTILPPNLLRFLIVRTPIMQALDFSPDKQSIFRVFDEFDHCMSAYFEKLHNRIPQGKKGEVMSDFARIIEFSSVERLPTRPFLLPRFRTIYHLLETHADVYAFFKKKKGKALTVKEKALLEERIHYAKLYRERYEKKETHRSSDVLNMTFSSEEKQFLILLSKHLPVKIASKDVIQTTISKILTTHSLSASRVFPAFYQVLTGKAYGPKASEVILSYGVKEVKKKLLDVVS